MVDATDIQEQIKQEITTHPVIVFMKGDRALPQCGFSGQVIYILNSYDIPYETRNVLESDTLREGIKEFSSWPTIPQLYVRGDFLGGCDIITELHENGELGEMLTAK
jgi:monothiol glutaredoxin